MGRSRDLADGTLAELNVDSNTLAVDATNNRVGIGTSSPSNKLQIYDSTATSTTFKANTLLNVSSNGSGADATINLTDGVANNAVISQLSGQLLFGTGAGAPERMRIDSSGNVLVNTTGTGSYLDGKIIAIASGTSPALTVKNLSTNQFVASFWNNGTTGNNIIQQFITETSPSVRGSITYNRSGGVIAFNTSSDYRLKENIVDLPNSLETISKLKPRQFDWKETGNTTTGFIAHELAEICPHAVNGDKDDVDSDGNPVYQGVDASKLVPLLTAALQEAITKIESLETEMITVKSRLDALESA